MEFWGVEVKGGTPLEVRVEEDTVIHLSQASLGKSKNKAESVPLYVELDDRKICLGTLSHQNFPQIPFDLVFEKDFLLSHNWKNGSVYFCGYRSPMPEEGNYSTEEESEEEEEVPLVAAENGKPKAEDENEKSVKANAAKPDSAKQIVKIAEPSKDQKSEDDDEDDSEDDDDSEDEEDSSEEENSDEMSFDESSDEEGEETPVKAEASKDAGKKRPSESPTKTPQAKKAKSATPEKTDGKKGGHTATPHPAKQGGKAAAQTSKSGGQVKCNSCSKTFNSEQALQSHSKAKHSSK
ncbi:hypothetical protein SLE2022_010640 [Rubroshorea leprosula]